MSKSRYMGRIWMLLAFVMLGTAALGQSVEFTANAPRVVEVGEQFLVEFSLNAVPDRDKFVPPVFSGVNVVAGPTESQGQSVSIINGKRSTSVSFSYIYALRAERAGTITIPAVKTEVDGRAYSTRPVSIEVVAGGQSSGAGGGTSGGGQNSQPSASLGKDDIVLKIIPSATNVYKGQPIKVSFKLYTRASLSGIDNVKYPAFNGFWTQEIDVSNLRWQQETLNNRLYDARVIREFLIFPQRSGVLQIEQLSLSVIAQVVTQNRRQSMFDDLFGGGPSVQEVRRNLTAGPIRITVKDLPAGAPAGFSGAVGQFTMTGGVSAAEIAANSSANYDITISGSGNLPLINAPKLELPGSFEPYPVKSTDNYNAVGNNISGSKTFSVPFIARAEGEYTIAGVPFSYFDPSTGRYVTLQTRETTVKIGKDMGGNASAGIVSGVSKEDLKILGDDIRFIRIGNPELRAIGSVFLWSWSYLLLLLLIVAAFVVTLIYMQKRIRFNSNTTLVRNKRAHKIALKRLKSAEKSMLAKNNAQFYEEMLKGLWGYMSDKLNIPVANLSRDNVKEGLAAKGVGPELSDRYITIIAECEYARYAPSAATQVGDVYNSAVELISKLESVI